MTIKDSVLKTYKYSSLFDFPLYPKEVLFWLATSKKTNLSKITPLLIKKLSREEVQKRIIRFKASQRKKLYAKSTLKFLKFFPFVQFVGISGSVSVDNATEKDDIDIFIITSPNTLWLIRPFVLLILEMLGVRRRKNTKSTHAQDLICPNLWLDANNLIIGNERRNLFTAHEVLQIFPLINKNETFENFIAKNRWVKKYLANAYNSSLRMSASGSSLRVSYSSRVNLIINNSICFLFFPINLIFFFLQYLFMLPQRRGEELGMGKAFFHNPNFQKKVLLSIN